MIDLVRGIRTRFTFNASNDAMALWSPDRTRIAFGRYRGGVFTGLFQKTVDGAGEDELIYDYDGTNLDCTTWSPDGRHIVCDGSAGGAETGRDIFLLSLSEGAELTPLIQTPFWENWPQLSPDGRWLAYGSNESGIFEVYVRPFPLRGGKWQVSTSGGSLPRWAPDGKELFYLGPEKTLMVAQLEPGERSLKVGHVESLFRASFAPTRGYPFDIAPDGQRFLVNLSPEQSGTSPVTLVVNWTADLNK